MNIKDSFEKIISYFSKGTGETLITGTFLVNNKIIEINADETLE